MSRLAIGVWVVLALLVAAHATSREEINYQGQLTYSNGDPIDSTVAMTFNIYSVPTSGTSLWSETHSSVTVQDGVFDVILGGTNPLPDSIFAQNDSLYVQTTVGATVMTPRVRLTSVPWAFDSERLDGIDGSGYALTGHDHLGETWDNTGGATALAIINGDDGFYVSVDSLAFEGVGTADSVPVVLGRNATSGTIGMLSGTDPGGLSRPRNKAGVVGAQIAGLLTGSLGTEREGVYGASPGTQVEGAVACAAEPQLSPMGFPVSAGVYGYAARPMATGGEFFNPAGPSAQGAGDDWALIIGTGHLAAAGINPGLTPFIPSPGLGPANVASMVLGGPVLWIPGPSPMTGMGASHCFIPDPTTTTNSLIYFNPSVYPYPGAFPGGPPMGIWFLDWVGWCQPYGWGFIIGSTAPEEVVDFVYWLVN